MERAQKYAQFHLDTVKSGEIFLQKMEHLDLSCATLAAMVGYSYNIVNDAVHGRSKELKMDLAVKLCMALHINFYDYIQHVFTGDWGAYGTDMLELFDLPKPVIPDIVQSSEAARSCPSMDFFVSQLNDAQERVMNRYKGIHDGYTQQLVKQQEAELEMLDNRYNASVKHLKEQIKKLERKNTIITWTLILENLALFGVLLFDALNRNVGWFRSFINWGSLMSPKS